MNIIGTILLGFVYFISLYFAIFWLIVFISHKDDVGKKKITEKPFVTIAIPAYNEEDSIEETFDSLLKLSYPKDKIEIIVVNDGSTDGTVKKVESIIAKHPNYSITLLSQKNKGKGAALNAAIKHAKGEYFICMDADSYIEKNALNKMLPYFSSPEIAVVIPMIKVRNPRNTLQKLQWYEYMINMFYKELMGKLNCVHVIPGPFSVYRKKVLEEVNGFDENNMTEDLEMAFRLQSRHYKIVQLLNTTVETYAPDNVKELYMQRNRWFKGATLNAINYRKMLFNKKYGDFGMMQAPSVILSGIIAIVLFVSLIYYAIKPYALYFYHMSLVNFDFITMIKTFRFDMGILDLNFVTVFIGIVMLAITLFILKNSLVSANEKVIKYGSFTIFIYLAFYFLILSIVWLGVFADILIGRKQRW